MFVSIRSDTNQNTIYNSPYNEGPAGTVPETGNKESTHGSDIVVTVFDTTAVNISENVGTQETGECHVPSLPVFLEILCFVW